MTKLKLLHRKLTSLHSKYIRQRDGFCVVCGIRDTLECGHIFTRANKSTMYDTHPEGNCHAQCHACNQLHESEPEHFTNWFIRRHGQDAYDELLRRSHLIKQYTLTELEDRIDELRLALGEGQ